MERIIDVLDGTAFKAACEAMDHLKAKAKEVKPAPHSASTSRKRRIIVDNALNAYVGILNDLVQHMTPASQRHAFFAGVSLKRCE